MGTLRNILVLCLLFLASTFLISQNFEDVNDEFPVSLSEGFFQDSYGFLWIATVDGLIRFDGYQTKQYNHDPLDSFSIVQNSVMSVSEDAHTNIWVGTSLYGANVLDRNSNQFHNVCFRDKDGECIKELGVIDFVKDGEMMWAATNRGLFSLSSQPPYQSINQYVSNSNDSLSISHNGVVSLHIDFEGTLWVGTRNGINKFDRVNSTFTNFRSNEGYAKGRIIGIDSDAKGKLWVAARFSKTPLYSWNKQLDVFQPEHSDKAHHFTEQLRITWDHDYNMWLSSHGNGLIKIDEKTDEAEFFDPLAADFHGYSNFYCHDNYTDRYGNIWFAGGQILKRPGSKKAIHNISSYSHPVISIYADQKDVWYCSMTPLRWNRDTKLTEDYWHDYFPINLREKPSVEISHKRLYKILELDENHLILVTTRNIFIWDKRDDSNQEFPTAIGGPFRDFAFQKETNSIIICPNQHHPARFNIETGVIDRPKALQVVKGAKTIEIDSQGDIWIGSGYSGLYRFNSETDSLTRYTYDNENIDRRISSNNVNDLLNDKKGNIWIATAQGLNLLPVNSDKLIHFNSQPGLPNEHIASLLEDRDGNIWMGTQNGISKYSVSDSSFYHLSKIDGLINGNYFPRSCYADNDGVLYFGGDNGIDFFDPNEIGINTIPPDVYISNVFVNNEPIQLEVAPENLTSINFDYKEKIIEIELLALHLTAPSANTYAYRIPEVSEDWIQLGTRRVITLANISPGTYTVEVKASNADNAWSDAKELLKLQIHPPFWLSWWFILLSLILIIGMLWAFYYYRTTQIRNQERIKSEFTKQISQLEMKALRAQMNPHFLFNSLNSIKSLISANENEKATEYVTRFSQLIRQVLANSEKPTVRLQEDIEALRLYLEIEKLRFQNFEYQIVVNEDVNTDFIEVPPLLLQPYVENAIWHGLMHKTKGHRQLDVSVAQEGDYLIMSVKDNGIGREQAQLIKVRGGSRKKGLGMRITKDRIMLLQNAYGQNASVVVDDLYETQNGSKHGCGTLVTIRIPVLD